MSLPSVTNTKKSAYFFWLNNFSTRKPQAQRSDKSFQSAFWELLLVAYGRTLELCNFPVKWANLSVIPRNTVATLAKNECQCSISRPQYRQTCYRKIDEPMKQKLKPKHPLKVHVCAGISRHTCCNATAICIFDGIMDADLFCNILESTFVPFIQEKLPDYLFMQDNYWNTRPGECRPSSRNRRSTGHGGVLPQKVPTWTWSRTCGMNLGIELRSSEGRNYCQRNVQNISPMFCTRRFQLWWRLKVLLQSFRSYCTLLCRIWIWQCIVGC